MKKREQMYRYIGKLEGKLNDQLTTGIDPGLYDEIRLTHNLLMAVFYRDEIENPIFYLISKNLYLLRLQMRASGGAGIK